MYTNALVNILVISRFSPFSRLAMHFVCLKCKGIMEGTMDSIKNLCDELETVNGFCFLGNRLNASGGCEAAVTARVRIG